MIGGRGCRGVVTPRPSCGSRQSIGSRQPFHCVFVPGSGAARGPPAIRRPIRAPFTGRTALGQRRHPLAQANQAPTGMITEGSQGMTQATSATTQRKGPRCYIAASERAATISAGGKAGP
jgi:hypothetical protein